jgi:predicted ATPase/transcriptional regulator with XRE-family HTH domain
MKIEETTLSVWIKQRRRALDLTQEDLADLVACSTITIQKIESGERRPSRQVARRLAECLQLSIDEQDDFVRLARGEARVQGRPEDGYAPWPRPASSSAYAPPTNLPAPLTPLLGREEALASACQFLLEEDIRLLTFTGAPGIGKTRLSLQAGADLLPHFGDGVFFVQLAPVSDPFRVASTIAVTLGLTESGSGSTQNDLKEFLTGKRMLLVLDNFEQVLDAGPLVLDLLGRCPGLKVLVTSREALHVPGEQQFPVSPLGLPDLARLPDLQALPTYPSIALFVERARAVDPTFLLNEENALDVSTICRRLDGLPLAIELAAARVRLFSIAEISARLDKRLSLLAGPARSVRFEHMPARQQTMRAAIDWSYQLLEPEEQQMLFRLSVFVGGWTLESADAVCGPGAADGVESLLAKNLVYKMRNVRDASVPHSGGRFTMLESIREYALEGLEASGEGEDARRRHALYFLDLAERAEPYLIREEQAEWFQRLEQERSNLVAAIAWSLARGEHDMSLRFGGALENFWYNRYPREGRCWVKGILNEALREGEGVPTLTRARALTSAAVLLRKNREYPQARAMSEEALRLYRTLDDKLGTAISLRRLANLMSEMNLPGDKASMGKLYKESLELCEEIGDSLGVANVLGSLAELARGERDYPQAIEGFERSVAILRERGDKQGIADFETNLAYVLYHCAEYKRAKGLLTESLHLYREVASAYNVAWALVAWAGIERAQGDPRKAATLIGAANVLAAQGGTLFDPNDQRDREEIEAAISADLSAQEWCDAQERGSTLSMDEAIACALSNG